MYPSCFVLAPSTSAISLATLGFSAIHTIIDTKIVQAERRKKELVHFLSRGAAYLQSVALKCKQGGEKRSLFIFSPSEAQPIFPSRQSVRQSPACESILVGVSAGHWLILRGCPAERLAVGLVSGGSAGHFGGGETRKVRYRGRM